MSTVRPTVVIAVAVDGSGDGIEPTAPMAALLMVAAVVGGSKDGIFTTNSHDNDHHPCSSLDEDCTAGWRVRYDASHSL
jgi:hypothetical protein